MERIIKDSGKIRIHLKDGIPIIEVYHNGELSLADIAWIRNALLNEVSPPLQLPTDIIIDRSGSYSLSAEAYINMQQLMEEAKRVAYVTHAPSQEALVKLAADSYLADKPVASFSSIKKAMGWLKEST